MSVSRRVLKVDAWWERSGRNDRRRSPWNRYNDRNELHKRGTGMVTVSVTAVYLSTVILSPCRPLLSRWFKKNNMQGMSFLSKILQNSIWPKANDESFAANNTILRYD